MKILFYTFPGIMPQSPSFNAPWVSILAEMMASLSTTSSNQNRLLCGRRFQPIAEALIPFDRLSTIDEISLGIAINKKCSRHVPASAVFNATISDLQDSQTIVEVLLHALEEALDGLKPDLIISFASNADYLRLLWPDSKVIHMETSAFSRPPYTFNIILDPSGIYETSLTSNIPVSEYSCVVNSQSLALAEEFRVKVFDYYKRYNPLRNIGLNGDYRGSVLIPLQVSNYHSFYSQCEYKTQYEYLLDIAMATPRDIALIVTEHAGWERVMSNEPPFQNMEFMRKEFPNLHFSHVFRKYSSSSQYLLAQVDGVWSVSSNVGIQAALLGKLMGSPQSSQNSSLSDYYDPVSFFENLHTAPIDKLPALAWYLTRYSIPEFMWRNGDWLERRLHDLLYFDSNTDIDIPEIDGIYDHYEEMYVKFKSENKNTHFSNHDLDCRSIAKIEAENAALRSEAGATKQYAKIKSKPGERSFVLLNDTRAIDSYLHLGCNVVTEFIIQRCMDLGLTFHGAANNETECNLLLEQEGVDEVALIVFNGEGSLHHDNPRCLEMMRFCQKMKEKGAICVLLNSVWHENTVATGEFVSLFDIIAVRESESFVKINEFTNKAEIVPDFSFYAFDRCRKAHLNSGSPGLKGDICVIDNVIRDSAEKLHAFAETNELPFYLMGPSHLDMTSNPFFVYKTNKNEIYPKILTDTAQIFGADLCVTGRFHGLTAALAMETPVLALESNTPKVQGLLKDSDLSELLIDADDWNSMTEYRRKIELARRMDAWNSEFHEKAVIYKNNAIHQIDQLFAQIDKMVNPVRNHNRIYEYFRDCKNRLKKNLNSR